MAREQQKQMPMKVLISFDKLLRQYDAHLESEDALLATRAREILNIGKQYPFLRDGFYDPALLEEHAEVVKLVLKDAFSPILTHNEIKVASLPYYNITFNASERFKKIVADAGPGYEPIMRDQGEGMDYIMGCIVILKFHYGFNLDFGRPFFYDIPDANGVIRNYRMLYNGDFLDILPTDKAKHLTQDDVDELLERPDDVDLWMDKIPPESFIAKGFVISNLFDVTAEHSISQIKSKLIASDKRGTDDFMVDLRDTFRSFFRLNDIHVGFVDYNPRKNQFEPVHGKGMISYVLNGKETQKCTEALCKNSYKTLLEDNDYFSVPDVVKYVEKSGGLDPYRSLLDQGMKSAILAPIAYQGQLLGVLELVSTTVNALNGVNAKKLDDVMPFIITAVVRTKIEEENMIDAVIQNECTAVHGSVYWRFQEEAKRFIRDKAQGKDPAFTEIVFKDVYPLYGQIDIKDSSKARNKAIQTDLMIQLSQIHDVLERANEEQELPIYGELMFRVQRHLDSIKELLYTNSEQAIFDFVKEEINPVLAHLKKTSPAVAKFVTGYEAKIDAETESYYDHRKNYDESVTAINKQLALTLDKRQEEAQAMFPHFFERYKTDGVEHNMYIGKSIADNKDFNTLYLNNLRLWQLQVMCEMENVHYALKPKLPLDLDATSLILVYNTSLSIRFRLDEKQFDVDGTYNARYEIIKKRIDKSHIRGTRERLTQPGKIAIVYSQKKDELEYLRYITFLRHKGLLTEAVEIVELEGLQGVSGLKAIRVEILYSAGTSDKKSYTYDDLMETLRVD